MFKHVIIVQMAAFGMGAQEVVMQGIINFCYGIGNVVLVRQDAQLAMVGMLINARVVKQVIIFQAEIHVQHVQQDVPHALQHPTVNHALMVIIYKEPHVQHVTPIVKLVR